MTSQLDSISLADLDRVHGGADANQMITNYPNVMTPAQAARQFPGSDQARLRLYYSDMHKFFETPGPDSVHHYDANGVSLPGPGRR